MNNMSKNSDTTVKNDRLSEYLMPKSRHEFEAGLYVFIQWKEEVVGVWEIYLNSNYFGNYISYC